MFTTHDYPNKYVRPHNTWTENAHWPRRVRPPVQHAPRAVLSLRKRRAGRTDGRQTVTLRCPLDAASVAYALDRSN